MMRWARTSERGASGGDYDGEKPPRPSRAEIETLCLLSLVSDEGAYPAELAGALGLSMDLATAVDGACTPLVEAGWVERREDRVVRTEKGRAWLSQRLRELGVGDPAPGRRRPR